MKLLIMPAIFSWYSKSASIFTGIFDFRTAHEVFLMYQKPELTPVAHCVQISLLPQKIPTLPGWDIAARWLPAHEVAGDYYDFILLKSIHHPAPDQLTQLEKSIDAHKGDQFLYDDISMVLIKRL